MLAVERAESPGGVWRDNSYPGAACDVPTSLYSLSFADNPDWSHTYGRGWEIKNYAESVAAEFVDQIRYGCEVLSATWDSDEQRWCVETSEGPIRSRFVIAAPGALSRRRYLRSRGSTPTKAPSSTRLHGITHTT